MIVVVEGVDGTGKSTVCNLLAIALHARLYATPPEEYRKRRVHIEKTASDVEHYRFYLEGVRCASNELEKMRQEGVSVVVDRYWMTTVAYHRAMGLPAELGDFGSILLPDFTVYLEVASTVQQERLFRRGLTEGDKRTLAIQVRVREEYTRLLEGCPNAIQIDTSAILPEAVVMSILATLKPA